MTRNNQKIPKGWSVKRLGELANHVKYGIVDGPFGSNLKTEHYRNSGIPVIQSGFVTSQRFYAEKYLYVDYDLFQREKRSATHGNDIIMAKIGAHAGTSAILPENHPESILAGNCLKITINPMLANNRFILLTLHTKYDKDAFIDIKSTTAQPAISMENLKKLKLLLPPLPEQEKIAEILGTWDEAIEKLSSLIEQKKLLKKGLMQKLLTGKVRLFKTSPLAGEVADLSASEGLDYNDNIKISSHRMYQPYIKEFSRDMRKNSTKAENLLWQKIRNGQLGFKFRRQHQIDNKYIADFVCLEKRLIIELDGGQHNDRPKDKDRTLYLENNNFKVIRFWDNEILQNIDGCLEILLKEISLLNNPSPCPSPARGEGISATYSNFLPQGARKDAECSLDTPHLAQECHPLPQGARKNERFSQPWEEVKLGEIFNIKKGQGLSKEVLDDNGLNKCILYGELYTKYSEVIKDIESRTNQSGGILSQIGDILIPASTTTTGIDLANATALLKENVLLGGDINILRAKKEVSSIFFAYLLTHAYKFDIAKLAQGITIVHLYGEFLKNMKVYIPSDISEQQAIADVLSTADDEIDLLNKKLILFKEQKKGLMQQLLTGNIRVKVNSNEKMVL